MNNSINKTSEAVSTGHPDKVADQISDSIFDLLRSFKKDAQSAVEVACSANSVFVFGEIDKDIVNGTFNNTPELVQKISETVTNKIREIGYTETDYNPSIFFDITVQSSEINSAVEETSKQEAAAGDQGIVSGYATNETTLYHELHYILSHRVIERLEYLRKTDTLDFLNPDAKSQVTIEYDRNNEPVAIKHVLVSQCHKDTISVESLREILEPTVVEYLKDTIPVLVTNSDIALKLTESLSGATILINPAGTWNTGGPRADSGLTGRKLVVDNYGSSAPIGGGATSGKNLNKVDRSGAYYARNIAKSIVASGLSDRALVELSFAIGVAQPTSININTFGTNKIKTDEIHRLVCNSYDFSVTSMIELSESLDKFTRTSEHGNYTDDSFPWEIVKSL